MTVPKYVINILERSRFNFEDTEDTNYAAGYTINIKKETPYTSANTFRAEIDRFQKWVAKEYKKFGGTDDICFILYVPEQTRHCNQYATVTVFDPIMKYIEQYIKH